MKNSAVLIKVDGTEIELSKRPTLRESQDIVGGWIEFVRCGHGITLVVNEEGRLIGKSINPKASEIYGNSIVGDVIVLRGWRTLAAGRR